MSLRDPGFRKDSARSNLIPSVAKSLHAFILPLSFWSSFQAPTLTMEDGTVDESLVPNDCSSWEMNDVVSCCTLVCRVLRNVCAGCEMAQNRVRVCQCLPLLLTVLRICSTNKLTEKCTPDLFKSLYCTGLQAIGNSVASNSENAKVIWESGWPTPLLTVITDEHTADLKIIALMIIYNCLLKLPSHLRDFSNCEEGGLLVDTLLSITYGSNTGPVSENELRIKQESLVWLELLVNLLVANGFFIPIHQQISSRTKIREGEQCEWSETLFLYLIEDLVSAGIDKSSGSKVSFKLSAADCGYIANEFALILAICKENAFRSAGEQQSSKLMSCMMQFIQLIAAVTTEEGSEIRQAMREKGLLRNVVDLLRSVMVAQPASQKLADQKQPLGPVGECSPAPGAGSSSTPADCDMLRERGLKRDLVRVIANMCFRDRASQDAVRELGGIPLVLSCTCVDENNPYSREWSVVAIRNLCDNNLDNQKVACPALLDHAVRAMLNRGTAARALLGHGQAPLTPALDRRWEPWASAVVLMQRKSESDRLS